MLNKSYFEALYDWIWSCVRCDENFSSKEEGIQHWTLRHQGQEITEEERESIEGEISECKTFGVYTDDDFELEQGIFGSKSLREFSDGLMYYKKYVWQIPLSKVCMNCSMRRMIDKFKSKSGDVQVPLSLEFMRWFEKLCLEGIRTNALGGDTIDNPCIQIPIKYLNKIGPRL